MEKQSVLLIDTIHCVDGGYHLVRNDLAPKTAAAFGEDLTRNPAVCMEGLHLNGSCLKPGQGAYDRICSEAWPELQHIGFNPVLYAADPRMHLAPEIRRTTRMKLRLLIDFILSDIEIINEPGSFEEAMQWIKEGRRNFRVKAQPSRQIKEIADRIYRLEREWIKAYGHLVRRCSSHHEKVYVVAGVAHIIGLHIAFGWPIAWICNGIPHFDPARIYSVGMNLTLLGEGFFYLL